MISLANTQIAVVLRIKTVHILNTLPNQFVLRRLASIACLVVVDLCHELVDVVQAHDISAVREHSLMGLCALAATDDIGLPGRFASLCWGPRGLPGLLRSGLRHVGVLRSRV